MIKGLAFSYLENLAVQDILYENWVITAIDT